jgi:hypothetical protein
MNVKDLNCGKVRAGFAPTHLSNRFTGRTQVAPPQPENQNDYSMNKLTMIWLSIIQSVKQAWLLPQTLALAFKQRRQQIVLNEHQVERLDRLRNPSKYRGR